MDAYRRVPAGPSSYFSQASSAAAPFEPRLDHHGGSAASSGFLKGLRRLAAPLGTLMVLGLLLIYTAPNETQGSVPTNANAANVVLKAQAGLDGSAAARRAAPPVIRQVDLTLDEDSESTASVLSSESFAPTDTSNTDENTAVRTTSNLVGSAAAATSLTDNYPVYDEQGSTLDAVQEEISPEQIASSRNEQDVDDLSPTQIAAFQSEAARDDDLDDRILEDVVAYRKAPAIQVLSESTSVKYRMITLQHERYYRRIQSRLYVPRMKKTARLTVKEFAERFIKKSQPVIVPFEAMRHLGFTMHSFTLDELLDKYPNYKRPFTYRYGSPGPGELDLGPAVWALKQGRELIKTAKGRNFPRNTKVSLDKLSKLNVQHPPFILPDTPLLPASLWFATTTSSTPFHSDCCDNYAMMISGTKLWTVSPPSEARILHPTCQGGLCWVKSLDHPDEHASTAKQIELRDRLQKVTFELRPNEMLSLPCGWFHHVENLGPTIMINFWTKGGPGFLRFQDGSALPKESGASASVPSSRDLDDEDDAQEANLAFD